MKTRLLWIAIVAVGLAALYFGITQPHVSTVPRHLRDPIADLKPVAPPPIEPPVLTIPAIPPLTLPPIKPPVRFDPVLSRPEVPIQNAATIDFSLGTPMVKMHGKDQDALESALKEMAEAAKGTTFEAPKK
jgi:hypothetical protein